MLKRSLFAVLLSIDVCAAQVQADGELNIFIGAITRALN